MHIKNGRFLYGDCMELMKHIPDNSVDMILCDLPYGTTNTGEGRNTWDVILPFEPLWEQYFRITKENAAIVLTAAQPFTSQLISSQLKHYKYNWIWEKTRVTGVLNAKKQPLRNYEDVCVFYRSQCTYNPQGVTACFKQTSTGVSSDNTSSKNYGQLNQTGNGKYVQTETNYPKQIIKIPSETSTVHPTQKPVELFEYLIKTYSNEGETVLDNTAGSGTTAIAAINTNRKWICMEQDSEYFDKAYTRVLDHVVPLAEDELFG